MGSSTQFSIFFFTMTTLSKLVSGTQPLPSSFYRHGPGVIVEKWLSTSYYSFDRFNDIPDYPDCPTYVTNAENFENSDIYSYQQQHVRYRAIFVSTQTGKHKFFALCDNACQVYIEINPKGHQKIIEVDRYTGNNWNQRKWSVELDLMKGYRYEILAYHYGNGIGTDYFRLGVKFPDNTELKPITKQYLKRSMEYYKWKGLIAQKYDNFNFPDWSWYSLAYAYGNNPNYPNNPSSFTCKSSLYDPYQYQNFGDRYALRYIGYLKVPANASYKLKMWCNEICDFFITKNNVETSLGQFVIRDYGNPSSKIMETGLLSTQLLYPIKAFMAENVGSDYIRIQHKHGSSSYSGSWSGMLQNLETVETTKNVPVPILTMINSTSISVRLPSTPFLPPRDNWQYITNHEILYFISGNENAVQKITVSGSLPKTHIVTGLSKYTDYEFYFHYFGKIAGEDQNIITRSSLAKTDEDVPEIAPSNLKASAQTSTSIKIQWSTISPYKLWNGIGLGYEILYKQKVSNVSNWTSLITSGTSNRQLSITGLLNYTIYEIKVAGRTSKGSGAFGAIVEGRTKENVPSAPPLNIIAQNTSSSSITVTWDDVPADHQNGIILGYKVYVRKYGSVAGWNSEEVTVKTFSKSGLELWTLYSVKVSAKTSVGEGVISSAVTVRTDEDKPTAPPTDVSGNATGPQSLYVDWSDINPSQTNGIIIAYTLRYRRGDGKGAHEDMVIYNKTAEIKNLDEYVLYEIEVAGMTKKGLGVFSNKIQARTDESAPTAPPSNIRGRFNSSTSIILNWGLVPEGDRNGIITSYTISYRKTKDSNGWKNETISFEQTMFLIENLEYFTLYQIKVAASNKVDRGPFNSTIYVRTDADAPTKPPQNLTGHFVDHRSIRMTWNDVPVGYRSGDILKYVLFFKDVSTTGQPWKNISILNNKNNTGLRNCTINDLKIYTPYAFKIQAFTYKAGGVFSNNVTVWTDEFEPIQPPRNVTGQNASSTEIFLKWQEMQEIDGDANGEVIGYTVKYRVVDCHEDRPTGCNESQIFEITSNGSSPEIKIPGLRKFTKYSLSVQVFNSKGRGNFSKQINTTTAEDTPDAPPTIVETWPSKTDSVKVYWSPIPESFRNGIILGYRIFYKSIDTPLRQYNRAPRAVNPLAVYGAEPGEGMKEVNATTYEVEIAELKDYSWYRIRIGALTSVGLGVTFSINGTTKQGRPTVAPDLQVTDMHGFHEILLNWKAINRSLANGEVLGYRIEYWLSELYETPIPKTKVYSIDVFEPNRTAIIRKLSAFARYMIRILAFTEGGFGVWSDWKPGETCRCPKLLSAAKILLPPLVQRSGLDVLPKVLDEAVTSCCGNCAGKHGNSSINWYKDGSNSSSLKYSRQEALDAIAQGTHLALPLFNDVLETEGDIHNSQYTYVPLLPVQNLLIFVKDLTERELANTATSIIGISLLEQYPLLLLSALLTILAGIIFWVLECGKNAEMSSSCYKGTGSGIWLAFITMTTVGYGDIAPESSKGRLLGFAWMLVGLVLTSMVVGNLSSLLSIQFVFNPIDISSNGKVLTAEESLLITAQFYGSKIKIGNLSDGNNVQHSLLSGEVSKVAIDYYKASNLEKYLKHPEIVLEKVETIEASYGVILGGEVKRMKKCIKRYTKENEQQITDEINKRKIAFELGAKGSKDLISRMTSPHSDIMHQLTLFGGIFLGVFIFIGIVYEVIKKIRDRGKVSAQPAEIEKLCEEFSQKIFNLENEVSKKIADIEGVHGKERLSLSRMQYGKYEKLASMYPDLHVFDKSIPKLKGGREDENPYLDYSETAFNYSDDEVSVDMPIDYRSEQGM